MSGSRSRSRSPLFSPSVTQSKKAGAFEIPGPHSAESVYYESNYEDVSTLVILNFPMDWEYEALKDFLLKHCQSVVEENKLPNVVRNRNAKVILKFISSIPCFICYKKLLDVEIGGEKLKIEPVRKKTMSAKGDLKKKTMNASSSRPKILMMTAYTSNPNETYGLSLGFLSSLGIKPPLKNTVYICNLSPTVDKEKLTEVFSLAGRVVNVIMLLGNNRVSEKLNAKVEYDHPVEAVQAISMFNRQSLMGRQIYVNFDLHKYTITMPVGLQSLGPGLGKDGEPLRDIRQLVEIQPMKEQLSRELAELKAANELALASSAIMNANTTRALGSLQNIRTPLNVNTHRGINPLDPAASVFGLNVGQQNIQPWQRLLQQNKGNHWASTMAALQTHSSSTGTTAASTLAALQGHSNTSGHNAAGFGQALSVGQTNEILHTSNTNDGSSKSHSRNQSKFQSPSTSKYTDGHNDDKYRSFLTSSDMLVFNYLPSCVTGQALYNKLSEIGELMFAEMTGKGRAIVRFRNIQDAEQCIRYTMLRPENQRCSFLKLQLMLRGVQFVVAFYFNSIEQFNLSKVDGHTIEVKFF